MNATGEPVPNAAPTSLTTSEMQNNPSAVNGDLITRLSNEINNINLSSGLCQQIHVEVPMYKYYIQGDKVQRGHMQDMLLLDVNSGQTAQKSDSERDKVVKRRCTILE